jgi:metal-dependent HD superfamily phosphatase/phosphodiesterase
MNNNLSKETLFKNLIEKIVSEVYTDITKRDMDNIVDAVYCEKLHYIRDLILQLEQNKEV